MTAAPASASPRPALRYYGGKWKLADWIIGHFPPHRVYVEPFGGAASVLLRKPRAYAEIYNDLDEDVVNLFRVLRIPPARDALIAHLRLTPFARTEFDLAYEPTDDDVERARRLIIRSFMGFGSDGNNRAIPHTGFRSSSNRSGTTPAHDWVNYPVSLSAVANRFAGVVVESRDAAAVMQKHDGPATLHYVDPPYLPDLRSVKSRKGGARYHVYAHEMTVDDHVALLDVLWGLSGMVVLSGYQSSLYDSRLPGWAKAERQAFADGSRPRIEVIWINPAAAAQLRQPGLFSDVPEAPE